MGGWLRKCILSVLFATALACCAQEMVIESPATLPASPAAAESPEARAAFEQMAAKYRALESYQDTFQYVARVRMRGAAEPQTGYLDGTLVYAAPDRLRSRSELLELTCNAGHIVRYQPQSRQYTVGAGAEALADLRSGSGSSAVAGVHPLAVLLLARDLSPQDALGIRALTGVRPAERNGRGGQELTGLLAWDWLPRTGPAEFTAFIDGESGLLQEFRIVTTSPPEPRNPPIPPPDEQEQVEAADLTVTFSAIDVDPAVPADAFVFTRTGKRKVEAFGRAPDRERHPLDLLGSAAPPLTGTDIRGAKFDMADLQDRVVLVVFWDTWVPESDELLRCMERLAHEFAEQEFAVVAVARNGAASAGALKRMLAESPAGVHHVRDPEGAAAREWHVRGLPTAYLVAADRTIADVILTWTDVGAAQLAARIRRVKQGEPLYTPIELDERRGQAGDFDQQGGRTIVVQDVSPAASRLADIGSRELQGQRHNMHLQDLNGDGQPEFIMPDWSGGLSVVYPLTGTVENVRLTGLSGVSPQSVCAVPMDGQHGWFVAGSRWGQRGESQKPFVQLHSPGGEILWTATLPLSAEQDGNALASAGDLDGDGTCEFVVALSSFTREPLDEQSYSIRAQQYRIFVLDARGAVLATQPAVNGSIELLYVPAAPPGTPAPLLCIGGGQMQRLELRPKSAATNPESSAP